MDKNMATPPSQLGRARGVPAVKPKDMKGTLNRLWQLTRGHRKGLGFILLLSALASGSAILSPYLIGKVVNCIDGKAPGFQLLAALAALYLGDWLIRFLQQFLDGGHWAADDPAYPHQPVCSYGKASPCPFLTPGSTAN